jgi:plasmid stability protein
VREHDLTGHERIERSWDDSVYQRLKDRAHRNNRSIEAEACELIVAQVVDDERSRAVIARIAAYRERMKEKHGVQSGSAELIRADRDRY